MGSADNVMAPLSEAHADVEWPQVDPWRTAAAWLWLAYLTVHAALGVWLLR